MKRTDIEWVVNPDGSQGFSWNPLGWGCTNNCGYCYAKGIARRFGNSPLICKQYPSKEQVRLHGLNPKHTMCRNFFPHLHEERLEQPLKRKKPATIFLGSMCDLWDPNVPQVWRNRIWNVVEHTPHTYIVLTKQPHYIAECECAEMNLWVGVSVEDGSHEATARTFNLPEDQSGMRGRFVSCEPLLGAVPNWVLSGIDWIIIGAQTGPNRQPEAEWVRALVDEATRENIPMFAKDNLDWPDELGPKPRELPYLNR